VILVDFAVDGSRHILMPRGSDLLVLNGRVHGLGR
jgi:hypothetical protein